MGGENRWIGGYHLGHLTRAERDEDLWTALEIEIGPLVVDEEATALFEALTAGEGWATWRIGPLARPATPAERAAIEAGLGDLL